MSRLSTLEDDRGGFQFVGNAFQVKDKDARKPWHIQVKCKELEECVYPTVLH